MRRSQVSSRLQFASLMLRLWILFNPDKYLSGITESSISTEHTPAPCDARKDRTGINNRCMRSERPNLTLIFANVSSQECEISLFRRHFRFSPSDFLLGYGRKCEIQMWRGGCRCAAFKANKHKSAPPCMFAVFRKGTRTVRERGKGREQRCWSELNLHNRIIKKKRKKDAVV